MAPLDTRPAQRAREAVVAGPEDEVVVGHHRQRDAGVELGQLLEDAGSAWRRPPAPAARPPGSTGPSITGSEKGMPTSMASAPRGRGRADRLAPAGRARR